MSEVRLIDANALKEDLKQYFSDEVLDGVSARSIFNQILHDIDNAPTVNKCDNCDLMFIARSKENDKLLKDIAHSLAIIADNSMKKGNSQESGNETLHWVHSEAHRVMCPKCGCRVSITAAYEMKYCFKCGEKLGGIKNDNS